MLENTYVKLVNVQPSARSRWKNVRLFEMTLDLCLNKAVRPGFEMFGSFVINICVCIMPDN